MKTIFKKIFAYFLLVFTLIIPLSAKAVAPSLSNITSLPTSRFSSIEDLLTHVAAWLLTFVGALGVVAITYSGIMYLTAGPDEAQAEKAKNNIVWAVIGTVLAVGAYFIVNFIYSIPKS